MTVMTPSKRRMIPSRDRLRIREIARWFDLPEELVVTIYHTDSARWHRLNDHYQGALQNVDPETWAYARQQANEDAIWTVLGCLGLMLVAALLGVCLGGGWHLPH